MKHIILVLAFVFFSLPSMGYYWQYTPQWLSNQCPQPISFEGLLMQHDKGYKKLSKAIGKKQKELTGKLKKLQKVTKAYCGEKIKESDGDWEFEDEVILGREVDDDTVEFETDFSTVLDCDLEGKGFTRAFIRKIKGVGYTCSDGAHFQSASISDLVSIIEDYECDKPVHMKTVTRNTEECQALSSDCSNDSLLDNVNNKLAKELCSGINSNEQQCVEAIEKAIKDREEKKKLVDEIEILVSDLSDYFDDLSEEREEAIERLAKKQRQGKLEAHCPSGICFQKKKQSGWDLFEKILGTGLGVAGALYLGDRAIKSQDRLGYKTNTGALWGVGLAAAWPLLSGQLTGNNSSLLCAHTYGNHYGGFNQFGANGYNMYNPSGAYLAHPGMMGPLSAYGPNFLNGAFPFPQANFQAGLFPGQFPFPGANLQAGLFPGQFPFPGANFQAGPFGQFPFPQANFQAGLFPGQFPFPGANLQAGPFGQFPFPGANFQAGHFGQFPFPGANFQAGPFGAFSPFGGANFQGNFGGLTAANAQISAALAAQRAQMEYQQRRLQNQQVAQRRIQGIYTQISQLQGQVYQVYNDYLYGDVGSGRGYSVRYDDCYDYNSRYCRGDRRDRRYDYRRRSRRRSSRGR